MKNLFLKIILASMFILLLSFNAFASPSPETTGCVVEIESAFDANGNAINVELLKSDTVITIDTTSDAYKEGMITLDIYEISVPTGTVYPITIKFTSNCIFEDTQGGILLQNGATWDVMNTEFDTNTMTVIFDSPSPTGRFTVSFVLNADVTQVKVGTSPQTSDYMTIIVIAFSVVAVSATVAFALLKKRSKA